MGKRYKAAGTSDAVYVADLVLQADAKLLGEHYNKLRPPKKVDVLQAALVSFVVRRRGEEERGGRTGTLSLQRVRTSPNAHPKQHTHNKKTKDRPGRPMYAIEHLIEGDYVKHNNNSGFVSAGGAGGAHHAESAEALRHTPHAFSHFSYEFSAGRALCVDIQVGLGGLVAVVVWRAAGAHQWCFA